MRTKSPPPTHAFTLSEMMIALPIASVILAVTLATAVALQRSFNTVDRYSAAHMQQIRIVDFLARDVRRGVSVISDRTTQSVVIKLPRYIIQAGDPDATSANIGTPRPPKRTPTTGETTIDYGASLSTIEYKVVNSAIVRSEDGVVTTIATSTDNLIPESIDVQLSNTQYVTTEITFKPVSVADRQGTALYSTTYLRNRRRF